MATLRLATIVACTVVIATTSDFALISMAQPAKIFNQKIGFAGARPGEGINYSDDFRTICRWHSPPIREPQGRIVVHGIQAPAIQQRKGTHRIGVHYSLIVGEIVPVFGEMYRVYEAEDRVKDTQNLRAAVEFVPKKDLPMGIEPIKADSFVAPLARFKIERATVYDEWIEVTEIMPQKDAKPKATLLLGVANTPADRKATVEVGDIVLIGGHGFEVRGIVPANAKMKTAGWVEFAQSFLPEADLLRDKRAFIRPSPLEKGR